MLKVLIEAFKLWIMLF